MSIAYTISKKCRFAVVTAYGPIDLPACQVAITEVASDPNFDPHYRVLVDLRSMEFRSSTGEVRELASCLAQNREFFKNRVAIVVSGRFAYGMARMVTIYAELAGFNPMMVFDDLEEATTWMEQDE